MQKLFNKNFLLIFIIIFAAFFRLYGLNWDQNQHLHPDERFLTMVMDGIKWPKSFTEYFDADHSSLNPQNNGNSFFVYGTFPIFLTKWVAEIFQRGNYDDFALVGRFLSSLFDVGIVLLLFLIARIIDSRGKSFFPILAPILYALAVLPIQLSHFFAVETFLVFFLVAAFYILIELIKKNSLNLKLLVFFSLLGISLGLATASKITALFFIPIIALGIVYFLYCNISNFKIWKSWFFLISGIVILVISFYLTLRFTYPYLFASPKFWNITLNPKVLNNWKELKSFDDPTGWFPPAVQWVNTKPYVFPLKNLLFWGLGLPLGFLSLISVAYFLKLNILFLFQKKIKKILSSPNFILLLAVFWIISLFAYQGTQFAKPMRYFYPIYPFLILLAAWYINLLLNKFAYFKYKLLFLIGILLLCLIWPISFVSIYKQPHSRVQASEWIYDHVPKDSTLSAEHWDDGLPVNIGEKTSDSYGYKHIEFPLFGPDTEEKWLLMNSKINQVDYIIMSSNRLYGALPTFPNRYSKTIKYYQDLFSESLGFKKVAEFTSRPNLPIPFLHLCLTPPFFDYGGISKSIQECPDQGITFVDDYADETWTVYDHPKVIIFKKI